MEPIRMKLFAILSFGIIGIVTAQYDFQQVIDQTEYLQRLEKKGTNFTNRVVDIYPQLKNLTSGGLGPYFNRPVQNDTNTFQQPYNVTQRVSHGPYNSTERFLNQTRSSMPKGFCVKEVPTSSLLKHNEVVVAGNGSDPTLSRIQVCCDGYQRNIHNFRKCDPVCQDGCVNGFCESPNNCVCFPDHVRNFGGFCLPTCPIGCGNGYCNQDNTCTCRDGYTLEPNRKFCVPKCSNGCLNGNCTAPEECTCNKGFSFTSSGKCEPVCSKGCSNGVCVSTEVCSCHRGYTKVDDICQPICSKGCVNGKCVAPEVCECPGNGWSLDSSGAQCVASCDKPCLNGICSGPNKCDCRHGYALDNFDSFRCVPTCDPPCFNGVCSGPNMCICYQGYFKDRSVKGSQKCVKA